MVASTPLSHRNPTPLNHRTLLNYRKNISQKEHRENEEKHVNPE